MIYFLVILFGSLCLVAFGSTTALATDELDLSVGLKTLPLLRDHIVGQINMAIVFDDANPESRRDAAAIKAAVDNGIEVPGGEKLRAMMVPSRELPALKGASMIFLAKGAGPEAFDSVAQSASANGILSMSADVKCVRANKCVLGIVSRPTVEIYYSRVAATASRVGFSSAFVMLAKPN